MNTDMNNFFSPIFSIAAATVLVSTSMAASVPAALAGYDFVTGDQAKIGYAVTPGFTEKYAELQKGVGEKINAMDEAKRVEFAKNYNPDMLIPYNAEIWSDKKAYDEYKKEWQSTVMQGQAQVALSLQEAGDGQWNFFAVTKNPTNGQTVPLGISGLKYDAAKNTWSSSYGEMSPKEFKVTDDFIFKAQTGTEWKLEKEDIFAKTSQVLRITKTTDGKLVYVFYALAEQSKTTGAILSRQGYTLCFPVQQAQMNLGKPGSR